MSNDASSSFLRGIAKTLAEPNGVVGYRIALITVVVCVLAGVAPSLGQSPSPAVRILSCYVGSGRGVLTGGNVHRAVMEIRFRNDSGVQLSSLTWRARYGSGWIDFSDAGDFAPGVTVKHDLHVDMAAISETYYTEDPQNCTLIATLASDGAQWKKMGADPRSARIPTPRPDDAPSEPETYDNSIEDPVGIVGCAVSVTAGRTRGLGRKLGAGSLEARVRNLSGKPIDKIVLRAAYLSGGIDFVFGRSFAPNVLVKSDTHVFGQRTTSLVRDLPVATPVDYVSLDEPSNCTAVTAYYSDGTVWQNPSVNPSEPPLPTPLPT